MTSSLPSTAVLAILRQIMQAREHLKSQPVCMQWRMMQNPTSSLNDSLRFSIPILSSVQSLSCVRCCDPMDCSTPGLPVHHQLSEFTLIHVHWVGDAIQPSHPLLSFSSCLQSFPASGSFQKTQFFAWGGQWIGVSASASVLPMNIQDWFPLGWIGWIFLLSKGLSRVFSNTTVQKH